MNGELRIEADFTGIFPQDASSDAVECTRPSKAVGQDRRSVTEHPSAYPFYSAGHFRGGAPRKRHQQNSARIGMVDNEMGDAMRERVGFAGAGAGDDQERAAYFSIGKANAMFDSCALPVVQFF
jgi:hypothetical protein